MKIKSKLKNDKEVTFFFLNKDIEVFLHLPISIDANYYTEKLLRQYLIKYVRALSFFYFEFIGTPIYYLKIITQSNLYNE